MKEGIKAPQDQQWSVWDVRKKKIIVGSKRNVL